MFARFSDFCNICSQLSLLINITDHYVVLQCCTSARVFYNLFLWWFLCNFCTIFYDFCPIVFQLSRLSSITNCCWRSRWIRSLSSKWRRTDPRIVRDWTLETGWCPSTEKVSAEKATRKSSLLYKRGKWERYPLKTDACYDIFMTK